MKFKKRDPSTMSLIISTGTPTIIPSLIEYYFYKMNMAWMHLKYIYIQQYPFTVTRYLHGDH